MNILVFKIFENAVFMIIRSFETLTNVRFDMNVNVGYRFFLRLDF